jgi:hypothetical protein
MVSVDIIRDNINYDFSFLRENKHIDGVGWIKASRWIVDPYEESLETNEPGIDGLTPFDVYVRIWNLQVLEPQEAESFRNLIIKTLKRFPPNELYPEMLRMFIDLDVKFDPKLFYVSNLNLFPPFIVNIIKRSCIRHLPFIEDIQREVLNYI